MCQLARLGKKATAADPHWLDFQPRLLALPVLAPLPLPKLMLGF